MKRSIVVVCSDLHGGHRYGLLNPNTLLDEIDEEGNTIGDYHPELHKIQKYLWDIYTKQIEYVKRYSAGDEIIVIFNGDMTAGNKHKALLVSDRMADQIIIGVENSDPWYAIEPKAVRFIKGTGAHVFGEGSSEILITRMLQFRYPNSSTKVCDHALLNVCDMDIDISHHGPPPGSREWLKGNEARYYLRSLMLQEIEAGKVPPRLVLRGHYHEEIEESLIVRSNGHRYKSTLVISPSFTFIDEYARKVAKSPSRITHGTVMIEVVDGDILRVIPLTRTIDIRSKEKI